MVATRGSLHERCQPSLGGREGGREGEREGERERGEGGGRKGGRGEMRRNGGKERELEG